MRRRRARACSRACAAASGSSLCARWRATACAASRIGVPRHIVEERMQPFHLRAIERGGGAAVSAADFYAFQQRQGAWGRDAA